MPTGTGTGAPNETKETGTPPREVPQATFTGGAAGCSNIFAYRASADGTQYVVIQIDREQLALKMGSKQTVDLGKATGGVEVNVDVYASAPNGEKYCSDFGTEGPRVTRWTAEAGLLTIELLPDPTSTNEEKPTYRATLRLERVHFTSPEGGMAVIVPTVLMEDVRVGWLPG